VKMITIIIALFCVVLGILFFVFVKQRGPSFERAFKGKVVVLTGASQGIGVPLAEELAKHGAKLVLAARTEDALEQTAKK